MGILAGKALPGGTPDRERDPVGRTLMGGAQTIRRHPALSATYARPPLVSAAAMTTGRCAREPPATWLSD